MTNKTFYAVEFDCEFEAGRVVPGSVDGFTVIGETPHTQSDLNLYSGDANELVDGDDNAPESGVYHVYIIGTYEVVSGFDLDGDYADVEREIDSVKYWEY